MAISLVSVSSSVHALPPENPLHMPPQDFKRKPDRKYYFLTWRAFIARLITFGGALALTVYATHQMVLIVSQGDVTPLQWIMVGLFCTTFVWIALAACASVAGFIFSGRIKLKKVADIQQKKTALLMPVYNEDPTETCAALFAMGSALIKEGLGEQVEIFIISDSNDPELWVKEVAAVNQLKARLAPALNVWYRRRYHNAAKKAGNVHDFVSRWGARYDYMLVLDADSLLRASTLKQLMVRMASDDKSGIIQTLPCLYRGDTLFARLQQFAGSIYGPIVARGVTAWQGNDGNYWGHNAIIRVSAFAESAGLPKIEGVKPFKGDILSHDFVEAALIRRDGWKVYMLPDLKGSWEESPPSLSDVAIRDRRWAQGNIQHLAVLKARGLPWPNRFHMITGVMGYMASPFWFALILIGLVMAIQTHYVNVDYFSDEVSLLPNWPVFDSERMIELFVFTMGILLVPKALGLLRAFFNGPLRRSLGIIRMSFGAAVEVVFSVLYAPVFMLIHSKHIIDIFRGRDSGWSTQQRQYSTIPWLSLCRLHMWHTIIGMLMTATLYYYSPTLLIWLSPTLIGLVFAIPLSALSGSKTIAKIFRKFGILNIPEEVVSEEIINQRDRFADEVRQLVEQSSIEFLFANENAAKTHFLYIQAPPEPALGEAPTYRLSAAYKIDKAKSPLQALTWLSKQEKIELLSDSQLFSACKRSI